MIGEGALVKTISPMGLGPIHSNYTLHDWFLVFEVILKVKSVLAHGIFIVLTPSMGWEPYNHHKLQPHSIWYLVSPMLVVLLNTNCKPRYSVTNTKCQPYIICHSLQILWGIVDLQCCNYCHLPSKFLSKFQSSVTIFHHKLLRREGRDGWTHPPFTTVFVRLFIQSVIQEVTIAALNIIFSVVVVGYDLWQPCNGVH